MAFYEFNGCNFETFTFWEIGRDGLVTKNSGIRARIYCQHPMFQYLRRKGATPRGLLGYIPFNPDVVTLTQEQSESGIGIFQLKTEISDTDRRLELARMLILALDMAISLVHRYEQLNATDESRDAIGREFADGCRNLWKIHPVAKQAQLEA